MNPGDQEKLLGKIDQRFDKFEDRSDKMERRFDERLRVLERNMWMTIGGLAVVSAFVGWGLKHLADLLKL